MEKLKIDPKIGLYAVAFAIMLMPVLIFGLTYIFSFGDPIVLSSLDWVWSIACVISGGLLLVRLKIAWILSIIQIVLVAVINLCQFFMAINQEISLQYSFEFLFSLVTLSGILLIAYYYRYPYLDRRDTIFYGIADRYQVNFDTIVNDQLRGKTLSASISGFKIELEQPAELSKDVGHFITIPELGIHHAGVIVIDTDANRIRVRLKVMGVMQAFRLRAKLKAFPKEA